MTSTTITNHRLDNLQRLLKSQYLHLEEYVNSQTQLRNVLLQPSAYAAASATAASPSSNESTTNIIMSVAQYTQQKQQQAAVQRVFETTEQVRADLQQLEYFVVNHHHLLNDDDDGDNHDDHPSAKRLRLALQTHLECSQHVVETCYKCGNQWHELGIPVSYNQTKAAEIQMVALATLKASITRLRESLESS